MIKSYLELSCDEKDKLLVFLNRNNENVALSEMRKMFENKVYGNGDGILVFKKDNKVICVGRVVLKEIPLRGIAYIHFLDILESLPNKKEVIKEMINECYKKAEEYNANKILLGFRKKETTEMLHKIGFDADYVAFQ